jgi:menaquinone-dependent protoporphyrinogen IX oxidase
MKGIVVYDTSHGNTKKIAETIAETLKESGIEVDLFHVKDVKKLSAKDYKFIVLGSPTRFGTMSVHKLIIKSGVQLKRFLKSL